MANLELLTSKDIESERKRMEKIILWHLGAQRHEEYLQLIKEGYRPENAYNKVLGRTLREGDPRNKIDTSRVVT